MKLKDKIYTVREVAEILRVSRTTVKRMIKRGDMKATKINSRGDYRIPREEIEKILK